MPTMQEMVKRAYKRLGLIGLGEDPAAEEYEDGLEALNDMMHGWKADGVDVEHETLSLADDFPLDDSHVTGVAALLAVRLAEENGEQITPQLAGSAAAGWERLQADYIAAPEASFDGVLTNLPSNMRQTA